MVSQEQGSIAVSCQLEGYTSSGTFLEISATFPLWTFTFHPLEDTFDQVAVTHGTIAGNYLEVEQENEPGSTTLALLAFAFNVPAGE
jgi:hypothetical protein